MPRFVLNLHAQRQAHRRSISYEDIDFVLTHFDTRRDAQPLAGRRQSEIFIGSVRGNRLRVYALKNELPFEVTTVAWEDR